jgi:hypothetical protein
MVSAAMLLGLLTFVAGSALIAKASFARTARAFWPRPTLIDKDPIATSPHGDDMRFGMVLTVFGSILALPDMMGASLAPTTLTILGGVLALFVSAYTRYAKQLAASRVQP